MQSETDAPLQPFHDLVPCLLFVLDTDGRILEINGAARGVLGFDPAELAGRAVVDLVHPDERANVVELLAGGPGGRAVQQLEVRMRTRVGGHRWFQWTSSCHGTPRLYVAAVERTPGLAGAAWPHHINDPLRLLVDSIADCAIYLLDAQGFISSWTPGAQRIKGYEAADVLGKSVAMFYTPADRAAGLPERELELAREHGQLNTEGWRMRRDGHRFWASLVLLALRDPDGAVVGFGKVTRDLTEKRRADEAVRLSEERLRLLVDGAPDYAIIMLDPMGRVLTWNMGAERIKGYTTAEIVGEHFSRFYTPEDIAARKPTQALEAALAEGRYETEGWRMRKDGTRFWASVVITPLINPAGELISFGKVTRDLTKRRAAEEELRLSEERFRLLVDTVQDYAIFMLDPEGRVQSWNRGAQTLKGYSATDILGAHFSRFYPPEDIASRKPARELETALRDGRVEDEGWRVRKDGTRFWANVVITRLDDDAGRLLGFAKVTRDLTQRREMEQAILAANADLELRVAERTAQLAEADRTRRKLELQLLESAKMEAIGRLAGGVAHDFNNMLTVIKGNAELLADLGGSLDGEMQKEALQEVRDAAERSADLTHQLLAFSRRQILTPRILDLNELVRGMMGMLGRLIGEHVRIRTILAPDLLRTSADPSQLEQVIMNLVVNARDAMPDGGDLTIETLNARLDESYVASHHDVRPGAHVLLSISDTGVGMDEATRARIFEPFFTTKGPGRGTGLGLATVHGIVRQSGGHVQVYSEPGRGSTFKVYLPATATQVDGPRKKPIEVEPCRVAQPGVTILLVEDEAPVRRLARAVLTGAGHNVLDAPDGESALEVAEQAVHAIDLLLTDVVMPGMSGVELFERVRELRPGMRVLYMSGYTENAIVHQGVLEADVNFLPKPFTRDALCAKVREALEK